MIKVNSNSPQAFSNALASLRDKYNYRIPPINKKNIVEPLLKARPRKNLCSCIEREKCKQCQRRHTIVLDTIPPPPPKKRLAKK